MKFLFVTDTHITAKTPSSRQDDIKVTIAEKFKEIGEIIKEEDVDVVLHGGDFFNTPEVSNNSTGDIGEILKSYNVPIYVTPGSHDLYGYSTKTLGNTKLGLLNKLGVINILSRETGQLKLTEGDLTIGIEGQEFSSEIDENTLEDYRVDTLHCDYNILVIHSMLLENKFFENTKYTLLKDVNTAANLVLSGHYHPGYTEFDNGQTTFINPGSTLRTDCSKNSLEIKPKVVVFEVTKKDGQVDMSWKYVELKSAKDSKEVFSAKALEKKEINKDLKDFSSELNEAILSGFTLIDILNKYAKEHPEVKEHIDFIKQKYDELIPEEQDTGFVPSLDNVYIEKVEITNFQTHKKKTVEFVNGLNVIEGESNSGKTAIKRAIEWCLFDVPSGSEFITTGAKFSCVKTYLSNGKIIERRRTRSSSGHWKIIDAASNEETEFKGFGHRIPIEIINTHQMPELSVNGNKYRLNVFDQFESPFLIGYGSSERSSLIGSLVDADKADIILRELNSIKRRENQNIKQLEEIYEKQNAELQSYNYLDAYKEDLDKANALNNKLEKLNKELEVLKNLRNKYILSDNDLNNAKVKLNSIIKIDKTLISNIKEKANKYVMLINANKKLVYSDEQILEINNKLGKLKNTLEYKNITDSVKNKYALYENLIKLKDKYDKYDSFKYVSKKPIIDLLSKQIDFIKSKFNDYDKLVELNVVNDNINNYNNTISALENKLIKIKEIKKTLENKKAIGIEKVRKSKAVCPTCGHDIDVDKVLEGGI